MLFADLLAWLERGVLDQVENYVEGLIDDEGVKNGAAVAHKLLLQNALQYAAMAPADVLKELAEDAFHEFRHLLRDGGPGIYPGASSFPGIYGAADIFEDLIQPVRDVIHLWCNAGAAQVLGIDPAAAS